MLRLAETVKCVANIRPVRFLPSYSWLRTYPLNVYGFCQTPKTAQDPSFMRKEESDKVNKAGIMNFLSTAYSLGVPLVSAFSMGSWKGVIQQVYAMFKNNPNFWERYGSYITRLLLIVGVFAICLVGWIITQLAEEGSLTTLKSQLQEKQINWSRSHNLIKGIVQQILATQDLSLNFLKKNSHIQFIQASEETCYGQLLLLRLFNHQDFKKLQKKDKVVFLSVKRVLSQDKDKNIRILKSRVKNIEKVAQSKFKKKQHSTDSSMILIIDNVQELAAYLDSQENKQKLKGFFQQLNSLQQSRDVNVYAVSYDSLFLNDFLTQIKDPSLKITKTICKPIPEDCLQQIIQKKAMKLGENNFGSIIKSIADQIKSVKMFFSVYNICAQNKWKNTHQFHQFEEELKSVVQKQVYIRQQLKNAVFRGDQTFCQKKIRLLIRLLLDYSEAKGWKDKDLAAQNLSSEEHEIYRDLCKSKILFYLIFYKQEYEDEFFSIIKDNSFYHSVFREEYTKLKSQNQILSAKAEQYYSQIIEKSPANTQLPQELNDIPGE